VYVQEGLDAAGFDYDSEGIILVMHPVMSKIAREAFNFKYGQGTAADLFKLALVYVQEGLDAAGFDYDSEGIILVMHDEIMLEVKEERAEEAKEILTKAMLKAAYEMIDGVKFRISAGIGRHWAEAH
jgi:DNA polymerase-1